MKKYSYVENINDFKSRAKDWLKKYYVDLGDLENLSKENEEKHLCFKLAKIIKENDLIDGDKCHPAFCQYGSNASIGYSNNRQIYGFFMVKGIPFLGVGLYDDNSFPYYGVIYCNPLYDFRLYIPTKGNNLVNGIPRELNKIIEKQFIDVDKIIEDLEENFQQLSNDSIKNEIFETLDDFSSAIISLCPGEEEFIKYKTNEIIKLIKSL